MFRLILFYLAVYPLMAWSQGDSSGEAFAITLEPFLGYNKQSTTGRGIENGDQKNILFGSRMGGQYARFQTGIDYRLATGNYVTRQGARKYEYSQSGFGAYLGYLTPFLLRPYFVLQLSTKASLIPSNTVRTMRGDGMIFGLSVFLPLCSINFEYLKTEWDSIEESAVTRSLTETHSEGFNLSISWPFAF
ncbi:MAG: hypothetical protein A2X86_16635 [Bdellovibrionales bacterium GWA2_49_15]|nr:MAG: hypothetical protein A2X86_16635 [Bdellovibrionales bacterium GWA2_49_15]HAZ13733.1 hypothetical protein [Bdellovibrionales bacterium]